jgi:hypothetical protein
MTNRLPAARARRGIGRQDTADQIPRLTCLHAERALAVLERSWRLPDDGNFTKNIR